MKILTLLTDMLGTDATAQTLLPLALLLFGMVVVYILITSKEFPRVLIGVLLLVGAAYVLTGCTPRPADVGTQADAHARTVAADVAAQITQLQQSDAEARRNAELLQSLQAQQAIVNGQAAIAQAQASVDIAASHDAALLGVADKIAAASAPDYTFVLVLLPMIGIAAAILISMMFRLTPAQPAAPATAQPAMQVFIQIQAPQAPSYGVRTLIDMLDDGIPAAVRQAAQQRGGVPIYDYDQARWLIVDPRDSRKILATQRKQLTG